MQEQRLSSMLGTQQWPLSWRRVRCTHVLVKMLDKSEARAHPSHGLSMCATIVQVAIRRSVMLLAAVATAATLARFTGLHATGLMSVLICLVAMVAGAAKLRLCASVA